MNSLALSAVLFLVAPVSMSSTAPECSAASYLAGACVADVGADSVTIGASLSSPGSAPGSPGVVSVPAINPNGRALPARDFRCNLGSVELCTVEPAAGVAPITIADLASFTPAVGELVVQPENWGVLGIPTNFVATASDHVQQGTLLGQPVEVRWRPVAFTFDYGDGTVVTSDDAGALWQSSDDDWTATATSHEYTTRGDYTATVTITFEADLATGSGWATVPGTLELAAPAEAVQIFEVQTVLTRGDCIEYPNDPGCSP